MHPHTQCTHHQVPSQYHPQGIHVQESATCPTRITSFTTCAMVAAVPAAKSLLSCYAEQAVRNTLFKRTLCEYLSLDTTLSSKLKRSDNDINRFSPCITHEAQLPAASCISPSGRFQPGRPYLQALLPQSARAPGHSLDLGKCVP